MTSSLLTDRQSYNCSREPDWSGPDGPDTKDVQLTRQQPPEARRQQILDAVTSLLLENGLAATSVDAIARRAGIAKGTVYLYFPSRRDLLGALRARYADGLASQARWVFGRADPADPVSVAGAVSLLADELLGYARANRRLYHILFQEAGGREEDVMGALRNAMAGFLAQAMDQRALTPADPDLLARFLLAGLHAVLVPLAHRDRPGREHAMASLSVLLNRLLGPSPQPGAS